MTCKKLEMRVETRNSVYCSVVSCGTGQDLLHILVILAMENALKNINTHVNTHTLQSVQTVFLQSYIPCDAAKAVSFSWRIGYSSSRSLKTFIHPVT